MSSDMHTYSKMNIGKTELQTKLIYRYLGKGLVTCSLMLLVHCRMDVWATMCNNISVISW
jgi:hypothetical protein